MENPISCPDPKEVILKTVEELVGEMGLSCEVKIEETQEEPKNLICNVRTQDSRYLIGQHGINLQALQHVTRLIVRKRTASKINFIVDVNFYRQEKNESLAALAGNMAQQAILEKRAITLRPMSSYERRIIHLELSLDKRIKTESVGEGEDRRIVIKPVDLINV